MGLEEPKEPGALGKPRKQRPIVARQPALEGPVPHPFQGMQQPQGDDLTGPEVGFGVFGDGAQLLIDLVEQGSDKLHGDHTALLSWEGCHRAAWRSRLTTASTKTSTISLYSPMFAMWFVRD